jgi:hypothetical protein
LVKALTGRPTSPWSPPAEHRRTQPYERALCFGSTEWGRFHARGQRPCPPGRPEASSTRGGCQRRLRIEGEQVGTAPACAGKAEGTRTRRGKQSGGLREGPAPVPAGEADGAADGRRAGGGGGIHARWGSSGGSFARWGGQRRPEAPACAGVERDSRAGEDLGDERGRHQRCLVRSATTGGPQRWWLRSASRSKRVSGETRRA